MLWHFDPAHSQIQFSVKHMGISTVRGTFQAFTGEIDEQDGQVKTVSVDIDVASLSTANEQRDGHLKSPDFFDVATYPTARFVLTQFTRAGDDVTATGDLTIRGVTKPVTLKGEIGGPAKDPWGNEKVSAVLETKISRKEFGLTWNVALEAGGVLVSDEVKLHIDVQAAVAVAAA
ncbi:MAG: YceI family protein [Gemmatimonadaceae bacterium]|nr:YceI family protein [Gemmatimonadaceae bacterium]